MRVAELGIRAEDALRQLIVSRETRTSIDSGFKVYNDDKAWPLREAFPVPLLLHKRVEVLEQKFRYRAFIYNGELTALTQVDELAAHELELDELDELVQQLVHFFETSTVTWTKVAAAYPAKKEDDGEGEGGGATDMLLDMQETEEEKEARIAPSSRSTTTTAAARSTRPRCGPCSPTSASISPTRTRWPK